MKVEFELIAQVTSIKGNSTNIIDISAVLCFVLLICAVCITYLTLCCL
jgi:hypothetical protein